MCSNIDGFRDDHTKQSKTERERQILHNIMYMWNLKKIQQTSDYNKKRRRLIDTESKLVVTSGEREEGRGNIGLGSKRYKLLDIK